VRRPIGITNHYRDDGLPLFQCLGVRGGYLGMFKKQNREGRSVGSITFGYGRFASGIYLTVECEDTSASISVIATA